VPLQLDPVERVSWMYSGLLELDSLDLELHRQNTLDYISAHYSFSEYLNIQVVVASRKRAGVEAGTHLATSRVSNPLKSLISGNLSIL